jgi:diguanylate cyclase (GGDEF)-like protein
MLYKLIEPEEILEILNTIEKSNDQYKGLTFSTRQYFFSDPLMPMVDDYTAVGNKFAWEKFNCKNKEGYYVSMDANNFKLINMLGHHIGDESIKSIGYSLRKATIGLQQSKLFRSGGDEFVFFTENLNEVDIFIKKACEFMDEIKPINNDIKITVSFGIGKSYLEAEDALKIAKKKKLEIPHLISSLL